MNKYVHRFFAPMRVLILLTLASTFLAAPHVIAQLTWKPSPALPSGTSGTYAWVEGNEVNLQVPKVYDEGANVTLTYRLEIKVAQGYTNVEFFSVDTSNADYNVIKGTVPAGSAGNWAEFYYIAKGTSGSVTHEKQALVDFVCYDEPAFTETSIQEESYTSGQAIPTKTLPPVHSPGPGYVGMHRKISYSLSPALPTGLTFDASTRQITGTPAGASTQTEYTYTVTDGSDTTSENHLERSIEGQGPVTKTLTFDITVVSPADAMPVLSSEEQLQLGELLTFDTLIINELHNASDNTNDYLELRNVSAADLSLNDWQLSILTSHGNVAVGFPAGTIIPAGEILLLVNTPLADTADTAMSSVVVQTFAMPQGEFALILQGPSMIGDLAGNSLGDETIPTLAVDTVWSRSQPIVPGYLAEAWTESTQATPAEAADLNNDGVANILDLVLVASQFGMTDAPAADLNADGTVNIQDLILVANALNRVR